MLNSPSELKKWQEIALLITSTIGLFVGYSNGGFKGALVGVVIAFFSIGITFALGNFLENLTNTHYMKQKMTEDEYYRMEARKRLDKERR